MFPDAGSLANTTCVGALWYTSALKRNIHPVRIKMYHIVVSRETPLPLISSSAVIAGARVNIGVLRNIPIPNTNFETRATTQFHGPRQNPACLIGSREPD